MKFYSFQEIKDKSNCADIAKTIGLEVTKGRMRAIWRGGKNKTSVSINKDGWHDFATEESGSVIDLVALVKFDGDRQLAQEWLGDYLRLTPRINELKKNPTIGKTHYEELIEDGWIEKATYHYRDLAGAIVHSVIRMEHPDHPGKKEFLQRSASGRWNLKNVKTILYNWAGIADSKQVIIVEGEKDADTLIKLGLPATTNAGGAKKWKSEYSEALRGKHIVLLPDNDEPGKQHADLLAGELFNIAKTIKAIVLSSQPKGDVTDWIKSEGGSKERLLKLIAETEPLKNKNIMAQFEIAQAKEANKYPFRNYMLQEEYLQSGIKKIRQIPKQLNDLIEECHTRFLGFPRMIGEELFDQDRDTGEIVYIRSAPELFAWIARKSKQTITWGRGNDMVTKNEFFAGIRASATSYDAVSTVPDYPKRERVYYQHRPLPIPSQDHKYLNQLVDFFNPATSEHRILIKAFIAAPIFFKPLVPRPLWIIDSETSGAGKSTLATRVAMLYGHPAIEVKTRDFARDMQEVTKRLVSSQGRLARMLLIDNVTGTFASEELSAMVTMPYISGRPAYGRGEETRPNNLTYVITANNVSIDNDLAIRAFFIKLKKISIYDQYWNQRLTEFIEQNRFAIFADIIDCLKHPIQIDLQPFTRFPEFENVVLRGVCESKTQYQEVIATLAESKENSNIEEEWGKQIEDIFDFELQNIIPYSENFYVWIRSNVARKWAHRALPHARNPLQVLYNLARAGHLKKADPQIKVYPHRGRLRRRGIMWRYGNPSESSEPMIIGEIGDQVKIIEETIK